jgi:transposase
VLSFTRSLKVYVAVEPVELRKCCDGLEALVTQRLGEDLRQGAIFVFTNRRHSHLKSSAGMAPGSGWR